jgi:hypothetical protein
MWGVTPTSWSVGRTRFQLNCHNPTNNTKQLGWWGIIIGKKPQPPQKNNATQNQ